MELSLALECAEHAIEADIPVMLHGAPGTGKTDGLEALARRLRYYILTEAFSTLESVDLRGLPAHDGNGNVVWSKPDFIVKLEAMAKANDGRVIFFIDEINANGASVQAPLMQMFLKRSIGPHALPEGVRLVAAGNRMSDRAVAQRMSTALNNRMLHLDVDNPASVEGVREWCKWAAEAQIHPMMIAFVMLRGAPNGQEGKPGYQPGLLHYQNPNDASERAFPSPRSVAKASIFCDKPARVRHELIKGLCGEAFAAEFSGFANIYGTIPSPLAIVSNPQGAKVPAEPSAQYAVAMALARFANAGNFANVLIYMQRVGREFEIVTVTDAIRRSPDLTDTPAFINWAARNSDVAI